MAPNTLLIASFDIASPWNAVGTHLKAQGALSRSWARPGSGFTLLFEALVMALIRRMPVKSAAAILRTCDTRLLRLVNYNVARKESACSEATRLCVDERFGRKGLKYLNLFYDLEASFEAWEEDSIAAKAFVEELTAGKADNPGAASVDLSKAFFLAIVEALLKAAMNLDHFPIHNGRNDALGKVSVEEALLYPSQSRAPPTKHPKPGAVQQPEEAKRHPRQPTGFFAALAANDLDNDLTSRKDGVHDLFKAGLETK